MSKAKKIGIQFAIFLGLMCIELAGYYVALKMINRRTDVRGDNFHWVYQVDSLEKREGKLILTGFAFQTGIDAIGTDYELLLQDICSEKVKFMEIEYTKRTDVNEYFSCEYDFMYSGFVASIDLRKLDVEENDYELLLRIKDKKIAYRTGIYVSNGEIMYANPTIYEPLKVEGTYIEEIVQQGVLRVYRPDAGVYVYQHEGYFYWITNSDFEFDSDGDAWVEMQLTTTQNEKLPEERLKWNCDNVRFRFCDNEINNENLGEYRVTRREIPTEYAISTIWTGKAEEEWIWVQYFRPYYFLNK